VKPATITRLEQLKTSSATIAAARLDAIRAARSEGHTLSEIGAALGITRQRVHQLLRGDTKQ